MKRTLAVAAIALATVSSAAIGQAASATNQTASATNNDQKARPHLRQQLLTGLSQSGFSNIKVVPGSFYVRAEDQSGNPVSMFITPNSMAEVTTIGSNTDNNDSATNSHTAMNSMDSNSKNSTSGNPDAGVFAKIPSSDELGSKLIGLDVYNHDNKDIGTIKDIAINANGDVKGYIVSVGGFLGIGDHYVAVKPSAIDLSYNANDSKWHAKMDANAGQLKNAPEYKYPSKV